MSPLSVRGVVLLLTTLMTPGCQAVFGTYNVGVDTGVTDADVGTGGATQGTTRPLGGATQGGATGSGGLTASGGATGWGNCNGDQLYTCVDVSLLTCVNNKWVLKETCERVTFCNPNAGHCDKCAQDERRCGPSGDGGTAVFVCADPQVGFTQGTQCEASQYCADDVKRCVACEPNETHCVTGDAGLSTSATRCTDDRSGWYGVQCFPQCTVTGGKTDDCPICTSGSTGCQELTSSHKWLLRTCVGGAWTTSSECPGGCLQATDIAPAACL